MEFGYPRLTVAEVRDFVDTVILNGVSEDAVKGFFLRKGYAPATPDERKVEELVVELMAACAGATDKALEPVEAKFSGRVFEMLSEFDDAALGDEAFWSYLAVRFFWPFIHARQRASWLAAEGRSRSADDGDQGDDDREKLERYLIGRDHYQLPLRMFLRAQAIRNGDDFSLAEVGGTDFWRSQVLGVRTSRYPTLARSVVKAQSELDLNIEAQRPAGRRVNRLRANVDFTNRSESDNDSLVVELWKSTDADQAELAKKKLTKKAVAKAKKAPKSKKGSVSGASVPDSEPTL